MTKKTYKIRPFFRKRFRIFPGYLFPRFSVLIPDLECENNPKKHPEKSESFTKKTQESFKFWGLQMWIHATG